MPNTLTVDRYTYDLFSRSLSFPCLVEINGNRGMITANRYLLPLRRKPPASMCNIVTLQSQDGNTCACCTLISRVSGLHITIASLKGLTMDYFQAQSLATLALECSLTLYDIAINC